MFDLSFSKLILLLIIGLVVLGPQRLPVAIKTIAQWINALRRLSATVQLEINKELKLQELQDSLKKAEQSGLKDISPEIQASIDDLKRVTDSLQKSMQTEYQKTEQQVQHALTDPASVPLPPEDNSTPKTQDKS